MANLIDRLRSARALIKLGQRRARSGNVAGAAEAFELATTARAARSNDNLHAVLHLWIVHSGARNTLAARQAYLRATDLYPRKLGDSAADHSVGIGCDIAAYWTEFLHSARAAYRRDLDSGDPELTSLAGIGLAGLEMQYVEETYGASDDGVTIDEALRRAIDAGHPDYVPVAARWLSFSASQTRNVDMARIALAAVLSYGDRKQGSYIALNVGKLLKEQGYAAEAIDALRFAVDNSDTGVGSIAAEYLGELLAAQGDIEGARRAFQLVVDKSPDRPSRESAKAVLDEL